MHHMYDIIFHLQYSELEKVYFLKEKYYFMFQISFISSLLKIQQHNAFHTKSFDLSFQRCVNNNHTTLKRTTISLHVSHISFSSEYLVNASLLFHPIVQVWNLCISIRIAKSATEMIHLNNLQSDLWNESMLTYGIPQLTTPTNWLL